MDIQNHSDQFLATTTKEESPLIWFVGGGMKGQVHIW